MHHVILPRVLPQQKSRFLFSTELELLNRMVKNVEHLAESLPPKTVDLFRRLQRVHTECTPQVVSTEINKLRPGDTFAMFVRFQYCAIMIHVPDDEQVDDIQNVIEATFPGCVHPREIYTYDGDIEVHFYVFSN